MTHLSQLNRKVDLANERKEQLEVQPIEIKLATCLQVVLNAGWSITKDNWDDLLEVSGVNSIRSQYWEAYNIKRQLLLQKDIQNYNENYLSSSIFLPAERSAIKERTGGLHLNSVEVKKDPNAPTPMVPRVPEEFIIKAIPEELTLVLQSAVLLQLELGIDKQMIFMRIPRVKKPLAESEIAEEKTVEVDTSINSQELLCALHLTKLIQVVERQGEKAALKTILEGKPSTRPELDDRSEFSR